MAIGASAAGAWVATNATTHTVTLPAHATGDLLIVIAAAKAANPALLSNAITTPASGWTRVVHNADGGVSAGAGTGSVRLTIWYRVATSSSETDPIISWGTTAAPGIATGLVFTKAAGETWTPPAITTAPITAATSISTSPSGSLLTAGGVGIAVFTTADDSALTVPTWVITGSTATVGAAVVFPATPIATATSNDMAGTAAYRPVTAGSTAGGTYTLTATQAAAETGMSALIALAVTGGAGPVTGTGAGAGTASTSSGDAAETFIGTGGGTGTAATASGTGDVGAAGASGTGAGGQAVQTAVGSGLETITASGAAIGTAPSATGSGVESMTGSGAGAQIVETASGTGSSLVAVSGTGAGTQAAASATGEALQVFPGGGVQVPQSAYGEGTVEEIVVEPPIGGGGSIYFPRLRLVIGGAGAGTQARQSATGTGMVNDDDLVVMAA